MKQVVITGLADPHTRLLEGEALFRLYFIEMGSARSVGKVVKRLTKDGLFQHRTNRPFTRGGVWWAMWKWAMRNPLLSFQIYSEGLKQSDMNSGICREYTKEQYLHDLAIKVGNLYKRDKKKVEQWQRRAMNELMTSG